MLTIKTAVKNTEVKINLGFSPQETPFPNFQGINSNAPVTVCEFDVSIPLGPLCEVTTYKAIDLLPERGFLQRSNGQVEYGPLYSQEAIFDGENFIAIIPPERLNIDAYKYFIANSLGENTITYPILNTIPNTGFVSGVVGRGYTSSEITAYRGLNQISGEVFVAWNVISEVALSQHNGPKFTDIGEFSRCMTTNGIGNIVTLNNGINFFVWNSNEPGSRPTMVEIPPLIYNGGTFSTLNYEIHFDDPVIDQGFFGGVVGANDETVYIYCDDSNKKQVIIAIAKDGSVYDVLRFTGVIPDSLTLDNDGNIYAIATNGAQPVRLNLASNDASQLTPPTSLSCQNFCIPLFRR